MKKEDLRVFLNIAPVNAMWKYAKAIYKYGHKGITAAKAIIYYVKWQMVQKKKFYGLLNNVHNLRPFRPLRWKHKVCYFTGTLNGEKVFIKTGGEINTTGREVYAMTYAAEHSCILKKHIPNILTSGKDYLIEELVVGSPMIKNEQLIPQLYEIYKELRRYRILHLDIRPDNFIIKPDGELILIDFGYALVNSKDIYNRIEKTNKAKAIIKNVGSKYSPKNGTVDDAYSMLLTMKYVCPSLLQKFPEIWKELNEEIGVRAVSLE